MATADVFLLTPGGVVGVSRSFFSGCVGGFSRAGGGGGREGQTRMRA